MATLRVTPEKLSQLASHLETIQAAVSSSGSADIWVDRGAVADDRTADEIQRFVDDWSQGRERISDEIAELVAILRAAAETYSNADRAIADAAEPGGRP
ncbi:MAG: type VII secretion target [Acidimicrobiales bacterium]